MKAVLCNYQVGLADGIGSPILEVEVEAGSEASVKALARRVVNGLEEPGVSGGGEGVVIVWESGLCDYGDRSELRPGVFPRLQAELQVTGQPQPQPKVS